jgi:hypothetical protein
VSIDLTPYEQLPPWLLELADAERFTDELTTQVPEFRDGRLTLVKCRRDRIRLKGDAWMCSYDVTVRNARPDSVQQVRLTATLSSSNGQLNGKQAVAAPFASPDWGCYLPALRVSVVPQPAEALLPSLPYLTESERARELLERSIASAGGRYTGFQLLDCTPEVMRYNPGSRCTVRYQMKYADEFADRGWPDIVVAKTYHGDKGRLAWHAMRELWDSPMATSGVAIAEPLAFLADLNVLVQGPVREERRLTDAIRAAVAAGSGSSDPSLRALIDQTARGLAAMHKSGARYGQLLTWEDERDEVAETLAELGAFTPELSTAAAPLLGELARVAARHAADPVGPAHRSFRPAQVLVFGEDIAFIDFDGFCQSEPALDVALFRATVKTLGTGDRGAVGASPAERLRLYAEIADEFLVAYEKYADIDRVRVALWEALDLLTVVLHCWTKVKPSRLGDSLWALQNHLAAQPLGFDVSS